MNVEEMARFLTEQGCTRVIDATHPYAIQVTKNIKEAVHHLPDMEYIRLKRKTETGTADAEITYFPDTPSCAEALEKIEGNILLTTGSKELAAYCTKEEVRERLYVRVLPGMESIRLCMEQNIAGKHILALQGPFSTKLNEALIDQYEIRCLVTKISGSAGGWEEKIQAAKKG